MEEAKEKVEDDREEERDEASEVKSMSRHMGHVVFQREVSHVCRQEEWKVYKHSRVRIMASTAWSWGSGCNMVRRFCV